MAECLVNAPARGFQWAEPLKAAQKKDGGECLSKLAWLVKQPVTQFEERPRDCLEGRLEMSVGRV